MRIAKPILLVSTPIGVAWGLYEAWRLAGGLAFLMAALVAFMCAAFGMLVYTVRRERSDEERKRKSTSASGESHS
jgi:hypothetical protein